MIGGSCDSGICHIQLGGGLHNKSNKTKKIKKTTKTKKLNKSKKPIKGGCDKDCSKPKLKTIFNGMKIIAKKI